MAESTRVTKRTRELYSTWKCVNDLLEAEDFSGARFLIEEEGLTGKMHVGVAPEDFTVQMVAEWVLSNIYECFSDGPMWIWNTARNISLVQYEKALREFPELESVT